jgi:DNA-binding NtrC family response regulator
MVSELTISSAAASCLRGQRVLIVEDTWAIAKAVQSLLEEVGMVIAGPSATVADAERLISEQPPQLAIVDVKLNGEMAYGLIECLHDRGISVVVLTGYSHFSLPPAKVAAILQKPFSEVELIATVGDILAQVPASAGVSRAATCRG